MNKLLNFIDEMFTISEQAKTILFWCKKIKHIHFLDSVKSSDLHIIYQYSKEICDILLREQCNDLQDWYLDIFCSKKMKLDNKLFSLDYNFDNPDDYSFCKEHLNGYKRDINGLLNDLEALYNELIIFLGR